MKFYCDQCNAQYFIADEKVGERGVKVRCKRCENVIVIRPTSEDAGSDEETVFPPPPGNEEQTRYPEDVPASRGAAADDDEDLSLPSLGDEDDEAAAEGLGDTAIAPSPYGPGPVLDDSAAPGNGRSALAQDELAASADDEDLGLEDDEQPVRPAPPAARSVAAAPIASVQGTEGDVLDHELAGAFDNVFGENSDPFAAQMTNENPDQSRLSTRFYSNNELAQVAEEKASAGVIPASLHDEISLPAASIRSERPAGGNGHGRTPFAGLSEPLPDAPPPPPAKIGFDTTKQWYVAIDDDQVGPVSVEDLSTYWDQRKVDGESLVWQSGLPDWMPVRDVLDLRDLVQAKSAPTPPRTAVEKARPPAAAAGLDIPSRSDDGDVPGASPFDLPDDPFAVAASEASLPAELAGSGTWRPHGMTEIYQAASLAESSAMQPLPEDEPAGEAEDEVNWQPGAAAALASLVEHEIDVIKRAPAPGDGLPIAEDSDVSGKPLPPLDDLLSTRPIKLPDADTAHRDDPFSQQISAHSTDDINIEQIAGQSSMVLKRPSFVAAAKPKKQVNWPLILGAGGGGLALIGLFIVVLVLLLRQPPAPVVVQAPALPPVTPQPGTPATGPQPGTAVPPNTAQPGTATGAGATATGTDPGTPVKADPGPGVVEPDGRKPDGVRKPATGTGPTTTKPVRKPDTKPDPKADPEPAPTPPPVSAKKGDCDPILYPDGNCPTGDARLPDKADPGKKSTLSKTDILMTVKKNLGDVKKCATEQASRNPRLATGTLKMQWYIRADGRTKNVSVLDSKYKGTYIGGCVQDAIGKWKFPTFDGEDVGPIKFPFPLD